MAYRKAEIGFTVHLFRLPKMAESKAFFVRPITWHDVSTGSTHPHKAAFRASARTEQKLRTTKTLNLHIDINGVYGHAAFESSVQHPQSTKIKV